MAARTHEGRWLIIRMPGKESELWHKANKLHNQCEDVDWNHSLLKQPVRNFNEIRSATMEEWLPGKRQSTTHPYRGNVEQWTVTSSKGATQNYSQVLQQALVPTPVQMDIDKGSWMDSSQPFPNHNVHGNIAILVNKYQQALDTCKRTYNPRGAYKWPHGNMVPQQPYLNIRTN